MNEPLTAGPSKVGPDNSELLSQLPIGGTIEAGSELLEGARSWLEGPHWWDRFFGDDQSDGPQKSETNEDGYPTCPVDEAPFCPVVPTEPAGPNYVDLPTSQAKAGALVNLMDGARDVLTENGVSADFEAQMAGIMANEGGRNQRRMKLGQWFGGQAATLQEKLAAVDSTELQTSPEKMAQFKARLTEDERAIYDKVQGGCLNLADLNSQDAATRSAAQAELTQIGVEKRGSQYAEMEQLQARQKTGTLTTEERARLQTLSSMKGEQIGFDSNERTTLSQITGMSRGRYQEIYEEGQQRFEPKQYVQLKTSYDKGLANQAHEDAGDPIKIHAGIGNFSMDADAQSQLATNDDLIADMSTSYGINQIMGAYAQGGFLKSKDATGTDHTWTIDELKASGSRLSPTTDDVAMQLAFMKMKGIQPSQAHTDASLVQPYNGAVPGSEDYDTYLSHLQTGKAAYLNARVAAGTGT